MANLLMCREGAKYAMLGAEHESISDPYWRQGERLILATLLANE